MDWFSGFGRRVWLACQEGLAMNCQTYWEQVSSGSPSDLGQPGTAQPGTAQPGTAQSGSPSGQIAARDSRSAVPLSPISQTPDDDASFGPDPASGPFHRSLH